MVGDASVLCLHQIEPTEEASGLCSAMGEVQSARASSTGVLSKGAIIGLVIGLVGGLLLASLVTSLLLWLLKKRRVQVVGMLHPLVCAALSSHVE